MKIGLSTAIKWGIGLIAILALAMGISGVAAASRPPIVNADQDTFANTLLLQDGINTINMLQAPTSQAPAQAAAEAPSGQASSMTSETGLKDLNIAPLPDGYMTNP